jgi:orotate phosphoribosyltransferase
MSRPQEQWIGEYEKRGALWIHDGNPKRPHVRLRSGLHSNGFFNSRSIIADENLLWDGTFDLLEKFDFAGGEVLLVEGVVGPQTGATKMAECLSKHIQGITKEPCFHASPAKEEAEGKTIMAFSQMERHLIPRASILLCEDVITTAGSLERTTTAIEALGGTLYPYVLVLVNRSGMKEWKGRRIVSLIDRHLPQWIKDECPLCRRGSAALPDPKDHWEELNAKY